MVKIKDLRSITPRTNGTRKESAITKIARHHSATTDGSWAAFWRHWNGTLKWGTGGYHEIILRDGTVELCYDPNEITNGVGGQNSYIYNICVVGNGSFTDAQEKAFDDRCKIAMARFNLRASDVLGHNEFPKQATSCPGINMTAVRKRLSSGNVVEQASKPKSPTKLTPSKPKGKSTSQMASEVIAGKHGSGHTNRRKSLGISQSEYEKVRSEVNKRAGAPTKSTTPATKKSVSQMAQEVLDGKHGNGNDARRKSLGISATEYGKVRLEVNRRLSGGVVTTKSISQMATEVIKGNHGSGHANRRKSLNISQAQYNKVRAEVNRRL